MRKYFTRKYSMAKTTGEFKKEQKDYAKSMKKERAARTKRAGYDLSKSGLHKKPKSRYGMRKKGKYVFTPARRRAAVANLRAARASKKKK